MFASESETRNVRFNLQFRINQFSLQNAQVRKIQSNSTLTDSGQIMCKILLVLTNDHLLFRSGPMLLKDDDRTHNTVLMGVIGTWPFLILLLSSAAIAGVIMWALVSMYILT